MKPSAPVGPLLDLAVRLADLKEDHYRQLLALSALIELLADKGLITAEELRLKASRMEAELDRDLTL
ncbi:hypothetical protein J19TS2_15590 [Cohnella xylanilytica]|uniref:hypothetical protein n=1 Tax=Cohnella xylanilytica TaxID=557555 RepID=UPI000A93557D|nr:hypothetical protein [Cohnella xylanilytica]GIO12004.1 hypothetical protein J19TS2_15590 [Cohnella xylanilytica]